MSNITFKVLKEAMLARGWGYKSDAPPLHPSALTWAHVFIKGYACFYCDYIHCFKTSNDCKDYTIQEVYDIITKEAAPKQVVLKVGYNLCGMYESACGKDIIGFTEQGEPINSSNTMCAFKSSTCDWFVNGVLYKHADILLPTDVVNNAAAPIKSTPVHDSDCSQHNEPAYPNEPCDCSASGKVVLRVSDVVQTTDNPATGYGRNISGFTVGGFYRKCDAPNSPILLSDWNYLWVNGVKCATKDIALPPSALLKQDILGSGDYFVPPAQVLPATATALVNDGELITPENLQQVLEYNGIEQENYCIYDEGIEIYCKSIMNITFNNDNWLPHVELEFGKLKPLPKYNYYDYIRQHSFESVRLALIKLIKDVTDDGVPNCVVNEEDAKTLCKIYDLVHLFFK